jgi:uncharacterized Zn-binding protein involved in type VI secretion
MPGVVRVGDANDAGGAVASGVDTVLVNGQPISVDGSPVSPHRKRHNSSVTSGGAANVIANGKPVNVQGNSDSCGHVRSGASGDVIIG